MLEVAAHDPEQEGTQAAFYNGLRLAPGRTTKMPPLQLRPYPPAGGVTGVSVRFPAAQSVQINLRSEEVGREAPNHLLGSGALFGLSQLQR
jgi:hypothetical protein